MKLGEDQIDQLTCNILLFLNDETSDGTATTVDLREALGADRGRSIKYRIREYLLPRDLVSEHERGTDETGRYLPHQYPLTDRGERFVEWFREDVEPNGDESVEERVERLEACVDRMAKTVRSLERGQQAGDER